VNFSLLKTPYRRRLTAVNLPFKVDGMNFYPMVMSTVTFLSTLLGGGVAARYRNRYGVLIAFAGGVLVAVPLLDLLPETLSLANQFNVSTETVMGLTALGFVFLMFLERYLSVKTVQDGDSFKIVRRAGGGVIGAVELSLHSFLDGLAIGLGFQFDSHVGLLVGVAIIAHDFSDGINVVAVMLNSGGTIKASLRMLVLDAVTPLLGTALTFFVAVPKRYILFFLPFFAGGFLYLGASELLPSACELNRPVVSFIAMLAGFLLIFFVARALNI
jgi:ZIP family zinc transporter